MKTIVVIFRAILVLLIVGGVAGCIVGGAMYCELHLFMGVGIMACFVCIIIGHMLPDRITDIDYWKGGWTLVGIILYVTSMIGISTGLRVVNGEDELKIVTPFYPIGQDLCTGHRIDTLKHIANCYERDLFGYYVHYCDMYLLEGKNCSSLLTQYSIIAQGRDFSFAKRDFGHGELYVCSFTDMNGVRKTIDMYGHNVNDSVYKPHVIDNIDYPTVE